VPPIACGWTSSTPGTATEPHGRPGAVEAHPADLTLKVGPDGIWLPDSGLLRWDDIAEVRLEVFATSAAESDPLRLYRRIGIGPKHGHVVPGVPAISEYVAVTEHRGALAGME